MPPKLQKSEAKKNIEKFFLDIKNKNPKEVKKIKKLAMRYNIHLGEKRKLFCKKCFNPYVKPKVRIKNRKKVITCGKCGEISRWKISI